MTVQSLAKPEPGAEQPATHEETLREFSDSFAYGARSDLLFKFLKRLNPAEAGEFLRQLLQRMGESIDDGNMERLLECVYEWNVRAYAGEPDGFEQYFYDEPPFTPLNKPVSQIRLGLLTATGHFAEGDDPEPFGEPGLTQADVIPRILDFLRSPPQLSSIPMDTPAHRLRVRHPGYDIRAMERDPNVGLPLARLRELEGEGVIGGLLPQAYSFVGASAQTPLLKVHAPRWAAQLREEGADAVLLVPA